MDSKEKVIFSPNMVLRVKDKVELVVARRRFMDEVGNLEPIPRPREGDLIYFPLRKLSV